MEVKLQALRASILDRGHAPAPKIHKHCFYH